MVDDKGRGFALYYLLNILVENREAVYREVNELLHQYSKCIELRVGYPVKEEDVGIIVLIVRADNNTMGAFSGKLGQIKGIRVKSILIRR